MTTDSTAPEVIHAWALYLRASEEARRRGDRRVGTDHLLLALLEDPSIEALVGVGLKEARDTLDALDHAAMTAVGFNAGPGVPVVAMRTVPEKPRFSDVAQRDRLRAAPAAKRALETAAKSNRRRAYVTAQQVLAQLLALQPPDPAAVLFVTLGVNSKEIRQRLDASAPTA